MAQYLLVDVGAGTLDLLWYDDASPLSYKAVLPSPVRLFETMVRETAGDLVVIGGEMGGGPVSQALLQKAKNNRVVMTRRSSATIHHDLQRVTSQGIEIVEKESVLEDEPFRSMARIQLADFDTGRINQVLRAFAVHTTPDVIGCCVQDHGVPPAGVSHLDHRQKTYRRYLDSDPDLRGLLFSAAGDELPKTFNRLRSVVDDARAFGAKEVFVMDSGMAAIIGARCDPRCAQARRIVVLDIATSHTVAAAYDSDELCGLVEYHTKDLDTSRLDDVLEKLVEGQLEHEQVLREGGHGAYCLRRLGSIDSIERIIATGPQRKMLQGSRLPVTLGAPFGDNMMTGPVGLLTAIRSRQKLPPPVGI